MSQKMFKIDGTRIAFVNVEKKEVDQIEQALRGADAKKMVRDGDFSLNFEGAYRYISRNSCVFALRVMGFTELKTRQKL